MNGPYKYKRVLLKISGEILGEPGKKGINFAQVGRVAERIHNLHEKTKIEIAVVVGAGNLFRGRDIEGTKVDPGTADYIGMLGTVMNALALQEEVERFGSVTRVLSAIEMKALCESFIRRRALRHLEKGRIVILGGGTGDPFFTTDSAAALRARELNCEVILKGTNVNGVYTADPKKDPKATIYDELTYQEALEKNLNVMDNTAFALCQREKIPIIVFNIEDPGNIEKIIRGEKVGTLVH